MDSFKTIKSKITPLDIINVDTDQIIPKQFLKLVQKTGYGNFLFYDWRFDQKNKLRNDFILNDPKYAERLILLTRENFGCGSSREHAVWALFDYGFSLDPDNYVEVNLMEQTLSTSKKIINFKIDPMKRRMLLEGTDEIDYTLQLEDRITNYENRYHR